ncbi:MAG: hypothetical protein ACOX8B_08490 [Lachnospiraceae bacterium]|jgi:hypothetical protein
MNAREKKLRRQYYDFEKSFSSITGDDSGEIFFWLTTAKMVQVSGCDRKEDLICHLQQCALSDIYGVSPLTDVQTENEEYKSVMAKYAVSARVDGLGSFWKDLIRTGDRENIRRTEIWLALLYSFFLPSMFHLITKWETDTEHYTDSGNMRLRKKAYNQSRREVEAMSDLLDDILSVYDLIGYPRLSIS